MTNTEQPTPTDAARPATEAMTKRKYKMPKIEEVEHRAMTESEVLALVEKIKPLLPFYACRDGDCQCGLIWSIPADAMMATTNTYEPESGEGRKADPEMTKYITEAMNALPRLLDELATVRGDNARLKEERRALLNVKSTDGLLSSEWIMRTAIAEAERDALRAEVASYHERADGYAGAVAELEEWRETVMELVNQHCADTYYGKPALYGMALSANESGLDMLEKHGYIKKFRGSDVYFYWVEPAALAAQPDGAPEAG